MTFWTSGTILPVVKLADFLQVQGISQAEFARRLDPPVSPGLVWQWLNGRTDITVEQAKRIVAATNGEVTAHDCIPEFFPPGFEFPRAAA